MNIDCDRHCLHGGIDHKIHAILFRYVIQYVPDVSVYDVKVYRLTNKPWLAVTSSLLRLRQWRRRWYRLLLTDMWGVFFAP